MKKKETYKIVGIDPGTNVLGYAVLQITGKKMSVCEIGVLKMKHLTTHQEKLKRIFERITALLEVHKPKEMAIEAPFYAKNIQSMLKLGRAQGVAIAAGMTQNVAVTEYSPRKIKQSVTGSGNASKEQVAAMLDNILDFTLEEYYLDGTDALAAAVCHFYQSGSAVGATKKYSGWDAFVKDNPSRTKK